MSQSVSFKIPPLDSNRLVVDAGCHTRFKDSQFFVLRTGRWKITLRHGMFWAISSFFHFLIICPFIQTSGFGSTLILVRNFSMFCFNPVRIGTHLPTVLVLNKFFVVS